LPGADASLGQYTVAPCRLADFARMPTEPRIHQDVVSPGHADQ
jgi:hypothetical protein